MQALNSVETYTLLPSGLRTRVSRFMVKGSYNKRFISTFLWRHAWHAVTLLVSGQFRYFWSRTHLQIIWVRNILSCIHAVSVFLWQSPINTGLSFNNIAVHCMPRIISLSLHRFSLTSRFCCQDVVPSVLSRHLIKIGFYKIKKLETVL